MTLNVQTQTMISQSSSAAHTISAFQPRACNKNNTVRNPGQNNFFASLTQAYKDSYVKYVKEKSNDTNLTFKSIAKLDQFIEDDQLGRENSNNQQEAWNLHKPIEFLA